MLPSFFSCLLPDKRSIRVVPNLNLEFIFYFRLSQKLSRLGRIRKIYRHEVHVTRLIVLDCKLRQEHVLTLAAYISKLAPVFASAF